MNVSIIVPDQMVIVDGRAISGISMSGIGPVRAVQWDGDSNIGHEEMDDGSNAGLVSISKYQFIIDRWQAAADAIDNPTYSKDEALTMKIAEICEYFNRRVMADFSYNGHTYTADYLQISGMSQNCLILTGTDPIPTPDGKWTSCEFEADGITPTRVAFTCTEFIQFAAAFANRRAVDFSIAQGHKIEARRIHKNNNQTADDILNYDHTTGGWV